MAVPDPETGRNLLVGLLKARLGRAFPSRFVCQEFSVLPSWQGVVVEPVSDRTTLRVVPDGFAIETGSALSPLPESGSALAERGGFDPAVRFPVRAGRHAVAPASGSGSGTGEGTPPGPA